jgi:GxxExxY protein
MNTDEPSRSPVRSIRDPQTHALIGAAIEVHNQLGFGFLEAVYLNALALELMDRQIPFKREVPIPVFYKGNRLQCGYRADFICFGSVLMELKAQATLSPVDDAQVLNYLRATHCERALLVNFGSPRLQYRRLILTNDQKGLSGPPVELGGEES